MFLVIGGICNVVDTLALLREWSCYFSAISRIERHSNAEQELSKAPADSG